MGLLLIVITVAQCTEQHDTWRHVQIPVREGMENPSTGAILIPVSEEIGITAAPSQKTFVLGASGGRGDDAPQPVVRALGPEGVV